MNLKRVTVSTSNRLPNFLRGTVEAVNGPTEPVPKWIDPESKE